MADEKDEIRARIDIVDLVGRRVVLKRTGRNWTGLCPFHDDKRPSFTVSSATGYYRCWSCGEKGDAFTWVMKTQGLEFAEALRLLAHEAGVTLKHTGPTAEPGERARQTAAMEEALSFFRAQFLRSEEAQAYATNRGLTQDILSHWEIGFSPAAGSVLSTILQKKGVSLHMAKELFLVDTDAGGGFYDKFRERLMFPIRNDRGELVAFGGRNLGSNDPKYINSSDTPLYRKSRVLYGLNHARETLFRSREAVLTEGYLDVIACHAAGVTNAVASLGTSLAEDHAKMLKRFCERVVILYDADAAGEKAAARAVQVLEAEGIQTRVSLMPPGQDPDTLLRSLGPAAVKQAVESSLSPLDFRMRSIENRLKPDEESFWTEIVAALVDAKLDIEREVHLTRLAAIYPGTRDVIAARRALQAQILRERRARSKPRGMALPVAAVSVEAQALEPSERVLFLALLGREKRETAWLNIVDQNLMITPQGELLRQAVADTFPLTMPEGEPREWLDQIEDKDAAEALVALEMEPYLGIPDDELEGAIAILKNRIQRSEVRLLITQGSSENRDLGDIRLRLQKSKEKGP